MLSRLCGVSWKCDPRKVLQIIPRIPGSAVPPHPQCCGPNVTSSACPHMAHPSLGAIPVRWDAASHSLSPPACQVRGGLKPQPPQHHSVTELSQSCHRAQVLQLSSVTPSPPPAWQQFLACHLVQPGRGGFIPWPGGVPSYHTLTFLGYICKSWVDFSASSQLQCQAQGCLSPLGTSDHITPSPACPVLLDTLTASFPNFHHPCSHSFTPLFTTLLSPSLFPPR